MPSAIQSRPRALIAIWHYLGGVSVLSDITTITCTETEDGSAGQFSFIATLNIASPEGLATAQAIGPMDVVAIYADRASIGVPRLIGQEPTYAPAFPLGPNLGPFESSALSYPTGGSATTTKAARTAALIFLGLIDNAQERKSPTSATSTLTVRGRDFSKIFITNNSLVPWNLQANVAADILRTTPAVSAGHLMLQLLDYCVSKNIASIGGSGVGAGATPTSGTGFAPGLGFPWRAFVDIDTSFDPGYTSFQQASVTGGPVTPAYTIQDGPAWSNAQQVQNAPNSRLFVNECGQLVFDDAFNAWTQQPVYSVIHPEFIIGDVAWSQDDSSVQSAIAVLPAGALGGALAETVGILAGTAWMQNNTALTRYGYRFQMFESLYDFTQDQAKERALILNWLYNNIWTASLTVMGEARYRAGQRTYLMYGGANVATQNRVWYIMSVTHRYTWGDSWATDLALAYPTQQARSSSPFSFIPGRSIALDGSEIAHPLGASANFHLYSPIPGFPQVTLT